MDDLALSPEVLPRWGLALCAGAGGLELGLHVADPGYRTVGYVERDAYAAAALVARMEDQALDQAPVWDDVKSFDGRPWRGLVDIVSAGYPCQPFSSSGRRRGTKDPRHIWPEIARIIRETETPAVLLENVAGHLRLGFDQVAGDLVAMGFRVAAGIFTVAGVGGSHKRERLFILAYADRAPTGPLSDHPTRRRKSGHFDKGELSVRHRSGCLRLDRVVDPDQRTEAVAIEDPGDPRELFLPAPFDLEAWDSRLRSSPGLQPAVFRDADGLANRLDRYRLVGNGVCSLAAAFAICTLHAELASAPGGG